MTVFLFILLTLGAARVTWFITEDHMPFVAVPRQKIVDKKPLGNLAYLVQCWFCTSVYISAGAASFAVWVLNSTVAHGTEMGDGLASFLILWPAFSFASVATMGTVDWLTSAPDHD